MKAEQYVNSIKSQSPTGDFLLGSTTVDPVVCPANLKCLNPPQGIFCWEVQGIYATHLRGESLNPPQGIFCWEVPTKGDKS